MKKLLLKVKSALFAEREIICISNGSIKSKKIGALFLIWNILLVLWTSFSTIKYFDLREKIIAREESIIKLKSNKQKLLSNIIILEKNTENIKNFIFSLNKYDRFSTIDENEINKNNSNTDLKNIELVLNKARNNVKNINLALVDRINGLENIKNQLSLNENIKRVSYEKEEVIPNISIDKDVMDSMLLKKNLDDNIDYLSNLEKFINAMPFSEPIDSNYVSSKYGTRLDPLIKTPRVHHGVDLVGSYMAKIKAPADGKVSFVGKKGGYGKTVVIEHEYGLKTVYAHLNSYNVKVGDYVKRGDIIAVQGNTGRSTGQHLHYEILRNNERFNPLDFVKIGSNLY